MLIKRLVNLPHFLKMLKATMQHGPASASNSDPQVDAVGFYPQLDCLASTNQIYLSLTRTLYLESWKLETGVRVSNKMRDIFILK